MRIANSLCVGSLLAALALGCDNGVDNLSTAPVTLGNPDSLTYVLLPSQPGVPAGVLLSWKAATDPNVTNYAVYAAVVGGGWNPVAYTGELSYFAPGTPANQYYVASMDANGDVSSGTSPITVSTAQVLPPPSTVTATAIDSGVNVTWSADARLANPSQFSYYRVYSEAAVVSGSDTTCPSGAASFGLEGSTVSEGYVVTGLANGTPWCFGVTTVAKLGQESSLSTWAIGTPSSTGGSFDIRAHPGEVVAAHRVRVTSRGR